MGNLAKNQVCKNYDSWIEWNPSEVKKSTQANWRRGWKRSATKIVYKFLEVIEIFSSGKNIFQGEISADFSITTVRNLLKQPIFKDVFFPGLTNYYQYLKTQCCT